MKWRKKCLLLFLCLLNLSDSVWMKRINFWIKWEVKEREKIAWVRDCCNFTIFCSFSFIVFCKSEISWSVLSFNFWLDSVNSPFSFSKLEIWVPNSVWIFWFSLFICLIQLSWKKSLGKKKRKKKTLFSPPSFSFVRPFLFLFLVTWFQYSLIEYLNYFQSLLPFWFLLQVLRFFLRSTVIINYYFERKWEKMFYSSFCVF